MALTTVVGVLTLTPLLIIGIIRISLLFLGRRLISQTRNTRDMIRALFKRDLEIASTENLVEVDNGWEKVGTQPEKSDQKQWSGVIGFFHPFCNAGGGGERVLWAAIEATQRKYPRAICAVYTGDHEIDRDMAVETAKKRFDIAIQPHSLQLIYLSNRHLVLATTWPHFTLLGQSIGSLFLAYDAFTLLVPDIFIDTMGYTFALAFSRYLFPSVPTAAYVHYPTISTDMLTSLDDQTGTKGIHAGAGSGWRGRAKKMYWRIFAYLYGWAGRQVNVVMCNSTWTANHIRQLWKPIRPTILYPPCPVEEIESKITLPIGASDDRDPTVLYVAQFRPEKNHTLILNAFANFYRTHSSSSKFSSKKPKLVLIGSVRSNTPDEKHIYALRLLAHELKMTDVTSFVTDAPFSLILQHLQTSSIGVNGMYAEHFGIGNVEGLAAGLIPVVHNSGGPKMDIVVPWQGKEVGFHAETTEQYANAFAKVLVEMSDVERIEMRSCGRQSARRFRGEVFVEGWLREVDKLVEMQRSRTER